MPHQPLVAAAAALLAIATCTGLTRQSAAVTALPPAEAMTKNGFDVSNATIPAEQILSGGPPRDGIPAIDEPRFVDVLRVAFLRDKDIVIGLNINGKARAYPLRILIWHEIVNDTVGGNAVAVTYCPLCGTAMAFERTVAGKTLSFGVSGLLYQSDLLMYDRQTESLWSQLGMEAVSGPMAGRKLRLLPSEYISWAAWRKGHSGGRVLSTETGHRRDYSRMPYAGYERYAGTMFPTRWTRHELGKKRWIIGVIVNGQAKAYPLEALQKQPPIEDRIGGERVLVAYDIAARNPLVTRERDGAPLPFTIGYWFAWQAFYPNTELYQP